MDSPGAKLASVRIVQATRGWAPIKEADAGCPKRGAARASKLIPNLSDTHRILGLPFHDVFDWNWKAAQAEYRRSLATGVQATWKPRSSWSLCRNLCSVV